MFPITYWPVAQEAAKQALKMIVDMHCVVPIPTYNTVPLHMVATITRHTGLVALPIS